MSESGQMLLARWQSCLRSFSSECSQLSVLDSARSASRWLDSISAIHEVCLPLLPTPGSLQAECAQLTQASRAMLDSCAGERSNSSSKPTRTRFVWRDSQLVRALRDGSWLLIDGANLCPASVLDRLNALLEPSGVLVVDESGTAEGRAGIVPHPDFRLFIAYDPRFGHVSRALRNRCLELFLSCGALREVYAPDHADAVAPVPIPSDLQLALYTETLSVSATVSTNTDTRLACCRSLQRVLSSMDSYLSLDVSVIRKLVASLFRVYSSLKSSDSVSESVIYDLLDADFSDAQFASIDRSALTKNLLAEVSTQKSASPVSVIHSLTLDFLLAGDPVRSHLLQRIEFLLTHLMPLFSADTGAKENHPLQLALFSQLLLFLDHLRESDLELVSSLLDHRLQLTDASNSESSELCSQVLRRYLSDERVRATLESTDSPRRRRLGLFSPVNVRGARLRGLAVILFLRTLVERYRSALSKAASLVAGTQWPPVVDALSSALQWAEDIASSETRQCLTTSNDDVVPSDTVVTNFQVLLTTCSS